MTLIFYYQFHSETLAGHLVPLCKLTQLGQEAIPDQRRLNGSEMPAFLR